MKNIFTLILSAIPKFRREKFTFGSFFTSETSGKLHKSNNFQVTISVQGTKVILLHECKVNQGILHGFFYIV